MLKIDFSKLVICTVSFGQTVIHLHTFILQNLLVLLIFQYKSLFGSGLSRLGHGEPTKQTNSKKLNIIITKSVDNVWACAT